MREISVLGDVRSTKTGDARDWTPEEAVRQALLDVQKGGQYENVIQAIVVLVIPGKNTPHITKYYRAGAGPLLSTGALMSVVCSLNN